MTHAPAAGPTLAGDPTLAADPSPGRARTGRNPSVERAHSSQKAARSGGEMARSGGPVGIAAGPGLRAGVVGTVLLVLVLVLAGCTSGEPEPTADTVPPTRAAAPLPTAEPGSSARPERALTGENAEGRRAPRVLDGTVPTVGGEDLDLAAVAGGPVVLWFWTPECDECRDGAADVARLAAAVDTEGLTVLGVARGDEGSLRAFVEQTGTEAFDHVIDADGSLADRFGMTERPAFVFLAADGSLQLVPGALDAADLRSRADALLE